MKTTFNILENACAYTQKEVASARFHNPNTLLWTHEYPDSRVVIVFKRISTVECVLEKRDREREREYVFFALNRKSIIQTYI